VGHTQAPLNAGPAVVRGRGFGAGLLAGLAAGFGAGVLAGLAAGFGAGAETAADDTIGLLCLSGTARAPLEPAAGLTRKRWPL
jgi:hypothetical protein